MATNTGEGIGNDVAKFYNKLEEKGKEFRQDSRIYHMRNFNNWLKSMLINEYSDKVKKSKPRPSSRHDDRYHKGCYFLRSRYFFLNQILKKCSIPTTL